MKFRLFFCRHDCVTSYYRCAAEILAALVMHHCNGLEKFTTLNTISDIEIRYPISNQFHGNAIRS